MKGLVAIALAFAAFSRIDPITSAIAQTSAVVAQTQENAPSRPPRREAPPPRVTRPSECAPDGRKCEGKRKLKGVVSDPLPTFEPRKGVGF